MVHIGPGVPKRSCKSVPFLVGLPAKARVWWRSAMVSRTLNHTISAAATATLLLFLLLLLLLLLPVPLLLLLLLLLPLLLLPLPLPLVLLLLLLVLLLQPMRRRLRRRRRVQFLLPLFPGFPQSSEIEHLAADFDDTFSRVCLQRLCKQESSQSCRADPANIRCRLASYTHRPQSSSFLGLPEKILNVNPQKEPLWVLWVL